MLPLTPSGAHNSCAHVVLALLAWRLPEEGWDVYPRSRVGLVPEWHSGTFAERPSLSLLLMRLLFPGDGTPSMSSCLHCQLLPSMSSCLPYQLPSQTSVVVLLSMREFCCVWLLHRMRNRAGDQLKLNTQWIVISPQQVGLQLHLLKRPWQICTGVKAKGTENEWQGSQ